MYYAGGELCLWWNCAELNEVFLHPPFSGSSRVGASRGCPFSWAGGHGRDFLERSSFLSRHWRYDDWLWYCTVMHLNGETLTFLVWFFGMPVLERVHGAVWNSRKARLSKRMAGKYNLELLYLSCNLNHVSFFSFLNLLLAEKDKNHSRWKWFQEKQWTWLYFLCHKWREQSNDSNVYQSCRQ